MLYKYLSSAFKRYEYFLASWAFVETFLLAGHRAGWGSLVYVLKQEGIYTELCQNNSHFQLRNDPSNSSSMNFTPIIDSRMDYHTFNESDQFNNSSETGKFPLNEFTKDRYEVTSCPEQDTIFEMVVTVSTVLASPFNLLIGQISFRSGIRTARMISIVMMCIGTVSFIIVSKERPWMIFVGYIGIANGGLWILQTNLQISYLFKNCGSTVAGFIAGAFDASGAVLLGVKLAYENGIQMWVSFIVILSSLSILCFSTFILLPKKVLVHKEKKLNKELPTFEAEYEPKTLSENSRLIDSNGSSMRSRLPFFAKKDHVEAEPELTMENVLDGRDGASNSGSSEEEQRYADAKPLEIRNRKSVLMSYILSATYIMYVFWGTANQLVFILFIGSVNAWLGHITNHDQEQDRFTVSTMTNFLFYTMLTAPVFSVLAGSSIDFFYSLQTDSRSTESRSMFALAIPCGLTSLIGVLLCVCMVCEKPEVTYAVAFLSVLYRSFLYSIWGSYLRYLYPTEYFSALIGVMLLISGILMFLQMPLFLWCQSSESGYRQVYGMLGLCSLLTFMQPVFLVYSGWKADSKTLQ